MLKNFPIIAIAVIVVGAVVGGVFGHRSDAAAEVGGVTNEMIVKQLREADKVVMDNYAGKPALEDLTEGSIQGMLWTLDPHSSFFNRRELKKLDEDTLLAVFEGVPQFEISKNELIQGIKAVDLLTEKAAVFPSKGEMRKTTQGGGVSVNKEKLLQFDKEISEKDLLNGKYILVQKGKKNYFLIIAK